ncbi:MAG: hypothetical protein MJA83_10510, partial [Gammaproteobacteria bacterium]|nr:hypothetical protein [Gammaproteobacteria bacterium]
AGDEGELQGVDAKLRINETTEFKAEYATTESIKGGVESEGDAYLAEITHQSSRITTKAYVRQQDADFGLSQQNASEGGMRKVGGDLNVRANDNVSLNVQAFRQENLADGSERFSAEASVNYSDQKYGASVGIREVKDDIAGTGTLKSRQLFAAGTVKLSDLITARAGTDFELEGSSESPDYPERHTLGLDFNLGNQTTVFVEQEYAKGENTDSEITRVGVRTVPWKQAQINTSVSQEATEFGPRTFANLGLTQSWAVNDKLALDFSVDRAKTLEDGTVPQLNEDFPSASGPTLNGDSDYTALSFGTTYRTEKWSWTNRIESLDSDNENRVGLFSGFFRDVGDGMAYSVGAQAFKSNLSDGSETFFGDIRLGIAYRPTLSKWIILDRLDLIYEENKSGNVDQTTSKIVNNLNINYLWSEQDQLSIQYGAKYVRTNFDGDDFDGYTDLVGVEYRRDINPRWDVGFQASVLHSYNNGAYDQSYGVSVGRSFAKNIWVSFGYNFEGFREDDFSLSKYTAEGAFVKFRIKFDQNTFKDFHKQWVSSRAGGKKGK